MPIDGLKQSFLAGPLNFIWFICSPPKFIQNTALLLVVVLFPLMTAPHVRARIPLGIMPAIGLGIGRVRVARRPGIRVPDHVVFPPRTAVAVAVGEGLAERRLRRALPPRHPARADDPAVPVVPRLVDVPVLDQPFRALVRRQAPVQRLLVDPQPAALGGRVPVRDEAVGPVGRVARLAAFVPVVHFDFRELEQPVRSFF